MGYGWDSLDKKSYNNKMGRYKFKREFKFIIRNIRTRLAPVLDIAGGSGRFSIPLLKFTNEITVIDINKTAIELLNQREPGINTICNDFLKAEFNEKYNLILCIEALGYFQDVESFLIKVNTLLQDDGRFIFTSLNASSWRFFLRKLRHWKSGPTPYNDLPFNDLEKLLGKCNFKIEKREGLMWTLMPLNSNSKLVAFFITIERLFGLQNWHAQSPVILYTVTKRN